MASYYTCKRSLELKAQIPLHCLFCIPVHFLTALIFSKEVASSILRTFNTSNVCKPVTLAKFFPCNSPKLVALSLTHNCFRMLSLLVVLRMRRLMNDTGESWVIATLVALIDERMVSSIVVLKANQSDCLKHQCVTN